jgi:dynein heavy chain
MERIQKHATEQGTDVAGGEASFANLYGLFLNNVKRNLHIILCMSPIGNGFRNRLR